MIPMVDTPRCPFRNGLCFGHRCACAVGVIPEDGKPIFWHCGLARFGGGEGPLICDETEPDEIEEG